jgi:ADP-heptose:LPS heptosyltransferase
MFSQIKRDAAFVGKHLTSVVGALFLLAAGQKVNKEGYEKRVLVMFGGGIGDVAIESIVCGYIKNYLGDREVYYLMPYKFTLPYAKENIFFDYRRAKKNPFYYFQLANQLRRIGFSDIIVLFQFWDGFLPSLAADVKPTRAFYSKEKERNPFYAIVSRLNRLARFFSFRKRAILVNVASEWDVQSAVKGWATAWPPGIFPNLAIKNAYFISQVIKTIKSDTPPLDTKGLLPLEQPRMEVVVDPVIEREYLQSLKQRGVDIERCCLIGLGSSNPSKNWPVEKFVAAAKALRELGLQIAIIDHKKDGDLIEEFARGYGDDFFNLGIEADMPKVFILIKHATLVLANDTSFVHLAVALQTPSVCVKAKEPRAYSFYGYERINKWMESDAFGVPVSAISVEPVINACRALIADRNKSPRQSGSFQFCFDTGGEGMIDI